MTDDEADVADAAVRTPPPRRRRGALPVKLVIAVGAVVVLGLGALCGVLGYRFYQDRQADRTRAMFLEAGKQGAVNLTSIDYRRAQADVQRILDSATGDFREDFVNRSDPLLDVVTKAQSISSGTVTEAGVEAMSAEEGQVLVALSVKTTVAGAPEAQPLRYWRMRLTVNKIGDSAKISKVDFVP